MNARTLAAIVAVGLLSACAGVRESLSGWLGSEPKPRAQYVGVSRAKLYREADASSDVIGELTLHEGVLVFRVDGDFASVRAETGGRSGWVRASQLIDALPRRPEPVASPAGPPVSPSAQTETPEPPPPEPEPERPAEPERSVFDPY